MDLIRNLYLYIFIYDVCTAIPLLQGLLEAQIREVKPPQSIMKKSYSVISISDQSGTDFTDIARTNCP